MRLDHARNLLSGTDMSLSEISAACGFATRSHFSKAFTARFGTAFTESNVGDMGGMDWQDILTGINHLVDQGLADAERLGLAGWSYGGFMTAWGLTQTNRFKAAMVGAAITNWLSFHGTSNLAVWDEIANNDNPYNRGGVYDKFSPMDFAHPS